MKTIYLNPTTIKKIDRRAKSVAKAWPERAQDWQLWEMCAVAQIAPPQALTFFRDDGLVVDGWNGYRKHPETRNNPCPSSAWQGFYRNEPHKDLAWRLYLAKKGLEQGKSAEEVVEEFGRYCKVGLTIVFEPTPMIWGYRACCTDCWTQEAAKARLEVEKVKKGFKRGHVEPGRWNNFRVVWETSKKPQKERFASALRVRIRK